VGEIGYNRHEFLYDLQFWEIRSIIRGYRRRVRDLWDSVRWQSWLILCGMGAKSLHEPTDLMKFPWDREAKDAEIPDELVTEIRNEIIEENKKRELEQTENV
jgi:hypothetical protein